MVLVFLSSCLKEEELNKGFSGYEPKNIGDGWTKKSALFNNVDSNALENVFSSIHNDDDSWTMRSLVVFRNGDIIAESYLKDESDRIDKRAIWSCNTQILGLLTGFLFDDFSLFPNDRIEQSIERYLTDHPDKTNITIENLLTMRSGIKFEDAKHLEVFRKQKTGSSIDYILKQEYETKPGSRFSHNYGDPQLISAVIQDITGKPADVFAKEKLFSKIGITNYRWERYPDGVSMGGFGITTSPRELAKIAQLVLNRGKWDSVQLISEQYIDEMLSVKVDKTGHSKLKYGYFWWTNPDKNYYIMWGKFGQYVFINPDKQSIVIMTSLEELDEEYHIDINKATSIADQVNKCLN